MKIRAIISSALIICGIAMAALYSHASLSFQKHPDISAALKEKSAPLVIKKLIFQMKEQLEKNDDQYPELLKEVENYADTCPDVASTAILHSMLAEMYQNYYQRNQWKIDQRTQLSDYVPEDIREWTANLFTNKIREELSLSLRPDSALRATPVGKFKEILQQGNTSLRPTLYEFLAFRALEIQPSDSTYQEVIDFQTEEGRTKEALLTRLDYLRFSYGNKNDQASREIYQTALNSLYQQYEREDFAAEILIAQLDLIQGSMYRYASNHWDSIRAEEAKLCELGIRRYADYPRTVVLRNRLLELEQPSISVSTDHTVYPEDALRLKVSYKNTPQITVRIHESKQTPLQVATRNYRTKEDARLGKLVKEVTFSLRVSNHYTEQDTTLYVPLEQPGLYECVTSAPGQQLRVISTVSVSRLAAVYRGLPGYKQEVLVTDLQSGKPVKDATITYYGGNSRQDLQRLGSIRTDANGLAALPANKQLFAFQATLPGDTSGMLTNLYPVGPEREGDKKPVELSLFTDRGLYRPGQTVYFKGIAYVKESDDPHTVAGQRYTVILYDTNGKEVTKKECETNEFGSFHGEFLLPQQGLSGTFRLQAGRTNSYIKVEEYKRPTFEVEFQPIREEIAFGDSVTLRGKAQTFSGIALTEGNITWRIIRRPFLFRGFTDTQVANGTTRLDHNGTFQIAFRPEKAENDPPFSHYYTYEVFASVTDSKGETQEGTYHFSVGESSLVLATNLSPQVAKDSLRIRIDARTLNGEPTTVDGTFRIIELLDQRNGEDLTIIEGKQITAGHFTSGQTIDSSLLASLASGRYRLYVKANDNQGRPSESQTDFILYSRTDKRPPIFTHQWVIKEKTDCLPGEEAEILFGTSDKEAYILYEWFKGSQRIHQERIKLSDRNRLFRIPFLPEYGDGIVATFTFIKEGELYVTQVPITRRQPNRQLAVKPITFRDRTLPGSQETWQFRITDADSALVSAEVLACLYDASLDKILPFDWYFSPQRLIHLQAPRFSTGSIFTRDFQADYQSITYTTVPEYQYDRLNWFGLFDAGIMIRGYGAINSRAALTGSVMMKSAAAPQAYVADAVLAEPEVQESQAAVFNQVEEASNDAGTPSVQPNSIRKNFAETAFFYPTLRTNEQGDVLINFTMPESNTTWKLQLLANTTDLKYGQLTEEVVTSKPLMVLPNTPRFLRQGDQVSLSAQVINNSEEELSGRARIELFDPATDEPIVCLSKSQRPFTLLPDSITTVRWTIPVPTQVNLMGVRIIADSKQASDGEQQLLPVLSDQVLITESKPFYLGQEKELQIPVAGTDGGKKLFRLTLELTANPIWYAVQALPTLTEPENDDALSWFAAYYSNTLASYIASANPRIQQVIEQWTAQGGNASTLYSNLEKNTELKNILLEETPWVMDATDETERKRRLALLFDLNRAANARETALHQLLQLQETQGGWSWFKGFPASRTITLSILQGMERLVHLNAVQYGQAEKEAQINALKFLDRRIQEDYDRLRRNNPDWQNTWPTPEQVDYLFVRSAYRDIPEAGGAREAIRFYTRQAEKYWEKYALIQKGEIALLAHRNGEKAVAAEILAWLEKTATTSTEMGMYWANNRRENNYFTSPIDTHCLLMETFAEIAPDSARTDSLKQWLLNQKRTQNWESTPGTVNAIYALLLTGGDWLNDSNVCTVQWGEQTFSTTEGDIATGYLKTTLPTETTQKKNDRNVYIRKTGDTPAWGAVYEQYFQPIRTVEGTKGALWADKKLFIEINNGTNRQLRPVEPGERLHVGDKVIVRLTVRTDREMDYVVLKDLRAGCFEPARQLSGTEYKDGIRYYRSPKDASEQFFFERLPIGTFVLEYPAYVSRSGEYAGGLSTIQCLYAPEFVSHTAGGTLSVTE